MEKLKALGGLALWLMFICAGAAMIWILVAGSAWAGRHLLPVLTTVGFWLAVALIVVFLPLSIFRRFRGFTGSTIFFSSYLFGLIAWLASVVITLDLWGAWAVVIGILLLGGAVVPFAILASIFSAKWFSLVFIVISLVLTWGTRLGGMALVESKESA